MTPCTRVKVSNRLDLWSFAAIGSTSEVTTAWRGSFQSFEIRNGVLTICGVRNGEEHP
jgi:hypothetical protein